MKTAERMEEAPGAIGLVEAYTALSQEAFAVWMRLHIASDQQLEAGRQELARLLGYSEGRSNVILRELRMKGYVHLRKAERPGLPTAVALVKRCKVGVGTRFVRLSIESDRRSVDGETSVAVERLMGCGHKQSVVRKPSMSSSQSPFGANHTDDHDQEDLVMSPDDLWCDPVLPKPVGNQSSRMEVKPRKSHPLLAGSNALFSIIRPGAPKKNSAKADSDSSHEKDCDSRLIREGKRLDLSKIPSKEERRAKRVLFKQSQPSPPGRGKPIDWDEIRLDLNGKPVVTFSPSRKQHEQYVRLVEAEYRRLSPRERKLRQALIAKLRSEFIRMYTRYRRAAYRELGRANTHYQVMKGEEKYAEKAALACLIKGITPDQVFQYWHENIGNFADRSMQVPPLTFLSQPANIDAVVIAGMSGVHRRPPPRKELSRHPMSDESLLHPKLRPGLTEAGFDLSEINDKYLVSIQAYAIDVVTGEQTVKMMPSSIRAMVKWAAENIYSRVNVKDYL